MNEHDFETPEVGLGLPHARLDAGRAAGRTRIERFDTPEPITVDVDRGVGHLRIVASDVPETIVRLRPRDDASAADRKAATDTRVELTGGTLSVRTLKTWRRFTSGSDGVVDVLIELPSGSNLAGHCDVGDVDADGLLGTCRYRTAMGRIRVQAAQTAHLRTSVGDIVLDSCGGEGDLATSSGRITVGAIGAAGAIRNANGETTVARAGGDLKIKSANGDIAVGSARQSLTAKTAHGSIRVGEVIQGEIDLQSSAGDIEIGIREGSAAWLDVKTSYGTVRSSLAPGGAPTPNQPTVNVRATTSYGDIALRRVAAADDLDTEEDRP